MSSRLRAVLLDLDGKPYGAYRSLRGVWDFGAFTLRVDHVQGDPFAGPSRVSVLIPAEAMASVVALARPGARAVGVADHLIRRFAHVARARGEKAGSGKSGLIAIDTPGAQTLGRSALRVSERGLEGRFFVGLPASGRRILGRAAAKLLVEMVPDLVQRVWLDIDASDAALRRAAEVNEDAEALRAQLKPRGHVAFVADGSLLPRRSGASSDPLETGAVPFRSPDSLAVEYETPNAGSIRGMGIREGITLIVGGGFHGKSTLLRALELGVWNHRPGDGRERVVTRRDAVKVRAEDGRSAADVDVSAYIGALPNGQDTDGFSTTNASGSTSQAVNVAEALELGASVLLIDEDTAATNFMARDAVMASLVATHLEPIRPFSEVAPALVDGGVTSLVMAVGASSAFLPHARHVLHMNAYRAVDVTSQARALVREGEGLRALSEPCAAPFRPRRLAVDSIPGWGERGFRVRCRGLDGMRLGESDVDLKLWEQVVSASQLRALGEAVGALTGRSPDGDAETLAELCRRWERRFHELGWDPRSDAPAHDHAEFRAVDLAAVLNRIREARFAITPRVPLDSK